MSEQQGEAWMLQWSQHLGVLINPESDAEQIQTAAQDIVTMTSEMCANALVNAAWRERAEPLLRALDEDASLFDEDGDCLFCWNHRSQGHTLECEVTQARTLLGEGGQG